MWGEEGEKIKSTKNQVFINIARHHQSVNEQLHRLICLFVVLAPPILCKHVQNNDILVMFIPLYLWLIVH